MLLATAISALLMALYATAPIALRHLPTERDIFESAIPTLQALSWGTLPLMVYFALRRYLQAFNHVRIVAAALISANLINILFDWLLIFGHDWRVAGMQSLVERLRCLDSTRVAGPGTRLVPVLMAIERRSTQKITNKQSRVTAEALASAALS